MNTKIIAGIVGGVLVASVSFYSGTLYGKSNNTPTRGQSGNGQNFTGGLGGNGTRTRGGGFTSGQIISKDPTSITIKTQDGSTKIVLIATSTQVMKTTSGSLGELTTGTNITVSGSANSDGSITAQNVQIRPAGAPPIGGGPRTGQ